MLGMTGVLFRHHFCNHFVGGYLACSLCGLNPGVKSYCVIHEISELERRKFHMNFEQVLMSR